MRDLRNTLSDSYQGMFFDEGPHTYTVKDKKLTPVSRVLENFHEKFDSDKWSKHIARKEGKTQQQVLDMWAKINKESIDRGHDVHDFAEAYAENLYYNGPKVWCRSDEIQKQAVMQFYYDLDAIYVPVGLELRMFNEELGIAGTTDILLFNKRTKKFVIADWKTNIDIFKNFADSTMLPPFQYTLDMPYNHYQIQLSMYQILLEEKNWPVEERWLIWLPHSGGYERYKTFDFTNILRKHLENDSWRNN